MFLKFLPLYMQRHFAIRPGQRGHKAKAAFGSISERLMMPYHPPHSRAGIEQCLRGAPNRGPGCHDPPPVRTREHAKWLLNEMCTARSLISIHSNFTMLSVYRFKNLGEPVFESTGQATEKQEGLVLWSYKRTTIADTKRGSR